MKHVFLSLLLIVFCVPRVCADIELSLTPANNNVFAGQDIAFNINFRTTQAMNVRGTDILMIAGAGDGSEGVFTSAVSNFFSSTPLDWDLTAPGQAFYTRSLATSNPSFIAVGANSTTHLGTLTMNTSGMTPGNHVVYFDVSSLILDSSNTQFSFDLNNPQVFVLTGANVHILTAVPEPSSLAAGTMLAVGGLLYRRRKSKRMSATKN